MQANFSTKFESYPQPSIKVIQHIEYQQYTSFQLNEIFVDKRRLILNGLQCPKNRPNYAKVSRIALPEQIIKYFGKKMCLQLSLPINKSVLDENISGHL